jgi:hypothetical protein
MRSSVWGGEGNGLPKPVLRGRALGRAWDELRALRRRQCRKLL